MLDFQGEYSHVLYQKMQIKNIIHIIVLFPQSIESLSLSLSISLHFDIA